MAVEVETEFDNDANLNDRCRCSADAHMLCYVTLYVIHAVQVETEFDNDADVRVLLLVHDTRPPFLDKRFLLTKQTGGAAGKRMCGFVQVGMYSEDKEKRGCLPQPCGREAGGWEAGVCFWAGCRADVGSFAQMRRVHLSALCIWLFCLSSQPSIPLLSSMPASASSSYCHASSKAPCYSQFSILMPAGPVLPLKDPTSDMAVISRQGSKLVKEVGGRLVQEPGGNFMRS